ncbi:MAG: glucosamine-6-phosphate deaminase [Planctomycetaceae bacterium]|nr:glucosamine-6-phosphate deaminase [Planctomycetaceae bacterium]
MITETAQKTQTSPAGSFLRLTKVPTLVFKNARQVDRHVALVVESLIRERSSAGLPTVLGLPTGSTPIGVYRELIRLHEEEDLDFSRVITFNIDEYWPIEPNAIQSYNRWMHETFFDHVNIPKENIHIPDGTLPLEKMTEYCDEYEREIERAGGIDLQLLGIGRTGHIGFNEPGTSRNSLTRLVTLDPVTRQDAASDFFCEENVPLQAITMGISTLLSARKVMLIALGEHKAPIVRRAAEEEVTEEITASFLQTHPNAILAVDQAAAAEMTAVKTPWLADNVNWTAESEKRAVLRLSQQTEKPLLKLETADFMEHSLYSLIRQRGPIDAIRQRVFDELSATICTKPGGDTPQKIIVFSPHPDDDVISMGGTLITLAEQGHDVHIAYMTSGNIAVFDHDALRHLDYVSRFHEIFGLCSESGESLEQQLRNDMANKPPGEPDSERVLNIKGLIRETEAQAAAETAGVPREKLHFLDMPFYRTGLVTKNDIGDEDVAIVADLLEKVNPGQIYVAGDLSDPHGTHRVCAQAILEALPIVRAQQVDPDVWLYRGAWQEFEPHEIERVVPLSPEVALRKKMAIFKHESQKDAALFPGTDQREFWLRAEERTKNTARTFNALGLPEFFALEGFVLSSDQL